MKFVSCLSEDEPILLNMKFIKKIVLGSLGSRSDIVIDLDGKAYECCDEDDNYATFEKCIVEI